MAPAPTTHTSPFPPSLLLHLLGEVRESLPGLVTGSSSLLDLVMYVRLVFSHNASDAIKSLLLSTGRTLEVKH